MRFVCRIAKARIQILLFHDNTGYANSPPPILPYTLFVCLVNYIILLQLIIFLYAVSSLRATIYYLANIVAISVLETYELHSYLSYQLASSFLCTTPLTS